MDKQQRHGAGLQRGHELCWTGPAGGACASPAAGATTYRYDNRGNRIGSTPPTGSVTTYVYDQANRLIQFGTEASYHYAPSGVRTSKVVDGQLTTFVWNQAAGLPLLLTESSAGATTHYLYGPGGLRYAQANPNGSPSDS
jgi:YD repeat-containing protein